MLVLGFALGMRHATDPDHVVAVSTIMSRERSLRAAAPIGALWGLGHTVTIFLVGGAIIAFGLAIPPHVGLGMELAVALMLVVLGALNVHGVMRHAPLSAHPQEEMLSRRAKSLRPLVIGVVHGLAGSAAVTLLVLGAVRSALWGAVYLLLFGMGTIAGMLLVTFAMALPVVLSARRFERFHRVLAISTGVASVAFGLGLVYEIGFVHGLFTSHPQWTPQ